MSRPIPLAQNRQIVPQLNPNSREAEGVSPGFQRQVLADGQVTRRDFVRVTLRQAVTSGVVNPVITTDPISRSDIRGFRNDAVTCCLEMAAITRQGNTPLMLQLNQFQINCATLSIQGTTTGNGHDVVLGVITPNQGNMYQPTGATSGAQMQLSNLLNNPLSFAITDTAGNSVLDITSLFISLVFFERLPPGAL